MPTEMQCAYEGMQGLREFLISSRDSSHLVYNQSIEFALGVNAFKETRHFTRT